MKFCAECEAAFDEAGFTDCKGEDRCGRDRALFSAQADQVKAAITLPMVVAIAELKLPEAIEPSYEITVALARLLKAALEQNEELLRQVSNREQRRSILRH